MPEVRTPERWGPRGGGAELTDVLDRKLKVCAKILYCMSGEGDRWTRLSKRSMSSSLTPWQVQWGLKWLTDHGYISKPRKGLYRITGKGEELLSCLMDYAR